MASHEIKLPIRLRCGALIGENPHSHLTITRPLARVTLNHEKLHLKIFWTQDYIFAPADIEKILPHQGLFSRGFRIAHVRSEYPWFIVIETTDDFEQWLRRFEAAGFKL